MSPDPRSIGGFSIEAFFDEPTNTISYLVGDPVTRTAAVIDPVLDFDIASGVADTRSAERIVAFAHDHDWLIAMVLETHAHADHLSAAPFIKAHTGAWIGIGAHIRAVQKLFRPVFAMDDLKTDGSDFDRLFDDGDRFTIGELAVEVLHVPGHTPADIAYRIGDAAFVGDTLFMPDYGTARTDFPGGDARTLYRSIRRLLVLPDETRLFMCHDYKHRAATTIAGRRRWASNVGRARTSMTVCARTISSLCASSATPAYRCPSCCYPRSKSTFVPAISTRRNRTASPICASR